MINMMKDKYNLVKVNNMTTRTMPTGTHAMLQGEQ